MSRIFLTGDTHNYLEIKKISYKNWPLGRELNKEDYLCILGDYGFPWDESRSDKYWLDWCEDRNFSIIFVDGNHINFPLLYQYPKEKWNGGYTHILRPHIHHLMRGQIFTINNMTFFTMGGATSIDKVYRKEGKSWWSQEIPSYEEMETGVINLTKYNNKVDYIITHCLPSSILDKFDKWCPQHDTLNNYLEKMIVQEVEFKKWFCGHYHVDRSFDNQKYNILYNDIIELLPDNTIKRVNN